MVRDKEQYFTPKNFTTALMQRVRIQGRVFEPTSGDGSISSVLHDHECNVITNDIDENLPAHFHMDVVDSDIWNIASGENGFDWVVTNPPFSIAGDVLRNGLGISKIGVALLLRITFVEPCSGRDKFLAMNPPHRMIVLPRYSFTGDGKSDSVTVAWFVWYKNPENHVSDSPIMIVPRDWIGMGRKKKNEFGEDSE